MRLSTVAVRWFVLLALLASASFARPALAGEVSGKLVLGAYKPAPEAPPKRLPFNWELENGFKQVLPERVEAPRELAVVLVGPGDARGMEFVDVSMRGGSLMPSTVVVRAGTTVKLKNEDEIAHEVFAEGLEGFSAEAISPRGVRSIHLGNTGNWPLRDNLLAHVRGHLHVIADVVAIGKVAPDGSYAFGEVVPGKYTLKVFHGTKEVLAQAVEVGDKATSIDPITLTALTDKPAAKP